MGQFFGQLARSIVAGPLDDWAQWLLRSIWGMPPLVQTVHILAVSSVMGSIVLINLRVLGLALPRQNASELVRRLMPWTWWALPALALSGLVFVFARPQRYAVNRVFGLKFTLLAGAIVFTALFQRLTTRDAAFWERSLGHRVAAKIIAGCSLLLWLGVVLAGRWIAYADYIFPPQ